MHFLFYCYKVLVNEFATGMVNVFFLDESSTELKMPVAIERCVRRQNVLFMHEKNQFSVEYFQFMKKLLTCNHYLINHALQEKMVILLLSMW